MQLGKSAWQALGPVSAAVSSVGLQVPYGKPFRIRVRATDSWGNSSAWTISDGVRVALVDDSHVSVERSGGWRRRSDSRSFSGAYRRSKTTSAMATLELYGYQVGLVGRVGPSGGPAQIQLDGNPGQLAQTHGATADHRRLLFLSPAADSASAHVIRVRNAGSPARPLVEIDAFVVLQPAT